MTIASCFLSLLAGFNIFIHVQVYSHHYTFQLDLSKREQAKCVFLNGESCCTMILGSTYFPTNDEIFFFWFNAWIRCHCVRQHVYATFSLSIHDLPVVSSVTVNTACRYHYHPLPPPPAMMVHFHDRFEGLKFKIIHNKAPTLGLMQSEHKSCVVVVWVPYILSSLRLVLGISGVLWTMSCNQHFDAFPGVY